MSSGTLSEPSRAGYVIPTPEESAATQKPGELAFDQNVAGIKQAYAALLRAEAGYKRLDPLVRGAGDPPIVKLVFPTGSKDDKGDQIICEVDMADVIRKLAKSSDDVVAIGQQMFGPIHHYLALAYQRAILTLANFSAGATKVLLAKASDAQ